MTPLNDNPRTSHFDRIADQWDGWHDLATLAQRFAAGLEELGVTSDELVLDVGCGTGNLTQALLAKLSPAGRVVAVDIAERMLQVARRKIPDPRVTWHRASAEELPLPDRTCDRVVCFSVWPHFSAAERAARELARVLRPGGHLHVWHLASRQAINHIHANAGEAVRHDVLPAATEVAALLAGAGLRVTQSVDSDDRYLVTATKPGE